MARSWQNSMDVLLDWGDGKGMGVAGDTLGAGRPESPATLRPSLFLLSQMEVLPGKGGDLNGVIKNGKKDKSSGITFVLRH